MEKIIKAKVRAIETGYYGNEIIQVGKEFTYEGPLNKQNKLPLWTEPVESDFYEKLNGGKKSAKVEVEEVESEEVEVEVEVEVEAPAKKAPVKKASNKKVSLADSIA